MAEWDDIWKSVGTPLSDPTEEGTFFKGLHRALYVRDRDPSLEDQRCRLCQKETESQLHLHKCKKIKPVWKTIFKALKDLGYGSPRDRILATVAGTAKAVALQKNWFLVKIILQVVHPVIY